MVPNIEDEGSGDEVLVQTKIEDLEEHLDNTERSI